MISHGLRFRVPTAVFAMLLTLCLGGAGLRAEVGVTTSGGNLGSIYILGTITDDPGPFGSVWAQYHPGSPARHILNSGGFLGGDGTPSILRDAASGRAVVAWSKNTPGGFDVVFSLFEGGNWSAPEVLAGTAADELDPVLVLSHDGAVHVFYWVADGSPRVMTRSASADLSSWSTPQQVSAPGAIAVRPSAVEHDGALRVAYEVHTYGLDTTPREIVLATETPAGYVADLVSTSYHAGPNRPEVHTSGQRLWVDWIDGPGTMSWTRQQDGTWGALSAEPFGSVEERDYHVRGEIRSQAVE